jgi:hypothetical protein
MPGEKFGGGQAAAAFALENLNAQRIAAAGD